MKNGYKVYVDQTFFEEVPSREQAIKDAELLHCFNPTAYHECYTPEGNGFYQLKPGDCHELIGGDGCLGCPSIYGAIYYGARYDSCKHAEAQSERAEKLRRMN